jgi:4-hydroxybenzoyl-CoA reductase subunit beta
MMRLPHFRYHAPRTVREAADLLSEGEAMIVAGGTDLLPNMKRRQQVPATLIGLRNIAELHAITNGDGVTVGAGVTLTALLRDARVRDAYSGLWQAARQIATPHLRNMGTIGGNLCLDTRCNYYDQNYEWRKAIDFCMKKDGQTCWVATSSPKCLAVSSTDTAPALMSLGADVTLTSAAGTRRVPLARLYRNDGIHYLTRRPDEILTAVHLPRLDGWRSTYWKLRRRGAFDFPVLGVACALKLDGSGTVEAARVVLGAVASCPLESSKAAAVLVGRTLTDEAIANAAEAAAQPARPMDNTDYTLHWRKRVTRDFVGYALRELRGDDTRELRRRVARQELLVVEIGGKTP